VGAEGGLQQALFVCVRDRGSKGESCAGSGARHLLKEMQAMLDREGIAPRELILRPCGCLGLCSQGPVMVSVPGEAAARKKPPKWKKAKRGDVYLRVEEREIRAILRSRLSKAAAAQ
jgi:(2Fe-2S) ferredoxin